MGASIAAELWQWDKLAVSEGRADLDGQSASRARCTVCLCTMTVRRDGAIHVHGPVRHRCPGSGEALSSIGLVHAAAVTATAVVCHPPPQEPSTAGAVLTGRLHIPILKRLPQTSRNVAKEVSQRRTLQWQMM